MNAGVGGLEADRRTVDGFDFTVQSNYLSGELLYRLLLPTLTRNAGRVVHVSSQAHVFALLLSTDDLTAFHRNMSPSGGGAYGRSKLLQIVGAHNAAKAQTAVRVTSVHPGACVSDMSLDGPKQEYESLALFGPQLSFIMPHVIRNSWFPVTYCSNNVLFGAFSRTVASGEFSQAFAPVRSGLPFVYPTTLGNPTVLKAIETATNRVLDPIVAQGLN